MDMANRTDVNVQMGECSYTILKSAVSKMLKFKFLPISDKLIEFPYARPEEMGTDYAME